MRIARIGLVGALLLGAAACQTEDGSAVASNVPPLAYVRYINAVPDTFNLTVRWVDQLDFSPMTFVNVPYREQGLGGFQGLEAGSRHFRVFTHDPRLPANNSPAVTAQMADTTFNFVAGQYYTIFHYGYARTGQTPAQRVFIINETIPTPATVSARLINADLRGGTYDLFSTTLPTVAPSGGTFINNVALTNGTTGFGAYTTRAVGNFSAHLTATGDLTSIFGAPVPSGTAGTVTVDPIGGANVAGTAMTGIVFGPDTDSASAASYNVTLASARRTVAATGISGAPGAWVVTDSVAGGVPVAANLCAPTADSFCRLTIRARAAQVPANPAIPARLAITVDLTGNTTNTYTTAADLSGYVDAGQYTYDVVRFTTRTIVWFVDRHPARTTP